MQLPHHIDSEMLNTHSETTIRPAVLEDVPALVALEEAMFAHDRISRRSFREFVTSESARLLIAASPEGVMAGYAVVLFRRTTSVARLYSIAVAPDFAKRGLGHRLVEAAETTAREKGELFMRLEVRPDNKAAIRLYQQHGFREFGRQLDYYEDHADALRFEKWLVSHAPESARVVPYYAQTTEFTCGAAALMMAMAALRPGLEMSRRLEFDIWREATSIYLISAPGGCDPVGVAVAANRRGLDATVHVNQSGPYFVDGHRKESARDIMIAAQEHLAAEAVERGIAIVEEPLSGDSLVKLLDSGAVVIVLVSTWRMYREREPHWVVAYDHDQRHIFVHDPFVDPEKHEVPFGKAALAIPISVFDAIAVYGRSRLRAAIVLRNSHP